MRLDRTRTFGVITGHERARYEQGGMLFGVDEESLPIERRKESERDRIIKHDLVLAAQEFLKTVLAGGPVSKSAVYRAAELNNQQWPVVKDAATLMNIQTFKFRTATMWKLPEEISVI